jgi:mRNA interferase RelE/StbE
MTAAPVYAIKWTETALKLVENIPDQRIRRLVSQRVDQLAQAPDQQGKPLVGELAGFRSVRAVGQRYRVIYRVARREVVVTIVAAGLRKHGARSDIYELAKKLLKQGLLR